MKKGIIMEVLNIVNELKRCKESINSSKDIEFKKKLD